MTKKYNLLVSLIISSLLLTACSSRKTVETEIPETAASTESAVSTELAAAETESASLTPTGFDPYAAENRYDIPQDMFEKRSGVDYGTLLKDVTYYSTIAEDNKQVNILLPAGYDENQTYPVTYVFF